MNAPRNALSPRVMLATAMHAQPGVNALLLGSGISTGAGMPTGWGVVTNLVEKAAVADSPDDHESHRLAAENPEAWWTAHGSGDLGYSSLLAALAPTPSARQGLLREYFTPTEADQELGLKIPSPGHRAIAELVKRGTIKVIVTTNFDRLMEQALDGAGIQPQIITRAEAVGGMTPLTHAHVTLIKLHGDYAELDTRNTVDELTSYPAEWSDLLARIFSEYGLLISGWSGDWDKALVASLEAAPLRYPLYWDSRSAKGDVAQRLLALHRGHVITAASADELFADLAASVDALDRLAEPPLTTSIAVARLKRCLADPVRRIELHDLVMGKTEQVASVVDELRVDGGVTYESLDERLTELLAATTPLLHLLIDGVHHDIEGAHSQLWIDVLQRLLDARRTLSGNEALIKLQHYPALLALRTMSIVAVHRDRDELLLYLLTTPQWHSPANSGGPKRTAHVLHMQVVLDSWIDRLPRWGGGPGWVYPQSHLLRSDLQTIFDGYLTGYDRYRTVCDDVEYRTGLVQELAREQGALRANSGEFVADREWDHGEPTRPYAEIRLREQIEARGPGPWATLTADGTWDNQELDTYRETLGHYRRWG
ncbi:SIR2 family protein [Mycolicibacterium austroafricanum]|uniref:SIR2 family protein n=1 Tax=Mycolicibacterium austroafricanum TaxID=39687 RepID=UPI000A0154A9|nr:SIR2 family protein [Mycolicibacterium austroafricanum]